jgi:hypothetical protein
VSVIFTAGGVDVWNPPTGIGMLYLAMADDLAAIAGGPTGLSAVVSDEITIDVPVFQAFVRSLLSGHPLFREMARGFVAISLAMLDRAGATVAYDDPALPPVVRAVGASMPL